MKSKKDTFEENVQKIYKNNGGVGEIQFYGESFGGTEIDFDTALFTVNVNGSLYDIKVCNTNEMLF